VNDASKPFFTQALDALKSGDRRGAAALLWRELREGNTSAKNLPSVAQLAANIGEFDLAIEASRRAVAPGSLDSLLAYWAMLGIYGRTQEALADIGRQSNAVLEHPSVLHCRGTAATQLGRFDEAQELFRRALARAPDMAPSWLSLAMLKKFDSGDPDIAAMERLERQPAQSAEGHAILCYALGKAYDDCGEPDRAFELFARGASLRRGSAQFDPAGISAAAQAIIREFNAENLNQLKPSGFAGQRSLFVTGLPRSGTTLVEQILLGHSAVADGEEVNLFWAAMIPARGIGLENARAYERRSGSADPWGEIARDYAHLIDQRFRTPELVVDKSLGQSLFIGPMLHSMPDARIAWLRRSPEDVALSCFSTYFSRGLPWTWSLTDIAEYMRSEDALFAHWSELFPDRILAVPYEELVQSPADWSERLQQHFGLPVEAGIEKASKAERTIGSASVSQARESISAARVGRSAAYERHLGPFRERYYR
jgi:tetratricopeptide (TPR) repeat protein